MSLNPFAADPAVPARLGSIPPDKVAALRTALGERLARRRQAVSANAGGVLDAEEARAVVEEYKLGGIEDLMLLALPVAEALARPPISGFLVGAVGLERETGNLIFGGNVEFPGTTLSTTVHGEGFLATRAFSRGTSLAAIAIGEAHPCAHCRQYLSEFSWAKDLVLIDPLGHRLTLAELYPWPFDPAYLGEAGAVPGCDNWPDLQFETAPAVLGDALLAAGRRCHAPYSKCPGAVALRLKDGATITGAAIESVAFNPTMSPLQAALIDLLAHGYAYADITEAILGTVAGGHVDYAVSTAELLTRVAPEARLTVAAWR